MAKVFKIAADGTATLDKQVDGAVEKVTTYLSSLMATDADKAYTPDIIRYGSGALNIANTIATSMFTRKRVEAGKAPIAKFLF